MQLQVQILSSPLRNSAYNKEDEMSEQAIENEIQAKGLKAPRLCPSDIDEAIVGETFTVLPSWKVMICELTLRNGFTVRGEAATVSKENFNTEIGEKISRENARNKVWELEGYLLQERIFNTNNTFTFYDRLIIERNELGEKLKKLIAFIQGDKFNELPDEDQLLLREQGDAMSNYVDALDKRIEVIESRTANT